MSAAVPYRPAPPRRPARRAARGLSVVELLVGVAAALVVVAAGATLLVAQLREQRAVRLEARLMQDLAGAIDLIARDLRRAGHWGDALAGLRTPSLAPAPNPYGAVTASEGIAFSYSLDAVENGTVDEGERFGWRLRAGTVEMRLGGRWQAVTDASTLRVTDFGVSPSIDEIGLEASCPRPCDAAAADAGTCPPRLQVRSATVSIAGHAAGNTRLARAVRTRVRLRNDAVVGACAA